MKLQSLIVYDYGQGVYPEPIRCCANKKTALTQLVWEFGKSWKCKILIQF